jgi:N utilization substance protein B
VDPADVGGPVETRRRARALQVLYAWEAQGRPPLDQVVAGLARITGPDSALLDSGDRLARETLARLDEIDRWIADAAEHWRLDRIGLPERLLLRLAVHDLLAETLPPRLAIDTALWLVRRYVGPAAVPFVNGVLDRIARTAGRL